MKKLIPIAIFSAAFLSGCASTSPGGTSTAAPAAATSPAPATAAIPAGPTRKVILVMTGSKVVVEARDWPSFKKEWNDTLTDYAKEAGMSFSMVDQIPAPSADNGTVLAVHVADYRMVGMGARIFFGAMTGKAYIDARVNFIDLKTGETFGGQDIDSSSNFMGWDNMTPQQVDAIGKQVFRAIKQKS